MVESSIVTYNNEIIDYQIGSLASVEFDFDKIWNYYKKFKRVFDFSDLNFFHVHPQNMLNESDIDINCMKGFFQAFNEIIRFHIVCFKNDDIYNLDCDVLTLVYRGHGIEIEKLYCYNFKHQDEGFIIMKLLSYSKFDMGK